MLPGRPTGNSPAAREQSQAGDGREDGEGRDCQADDQVRPGSAPRSGPARSGGPAGQVAPQGPEGRADGTPDGLRGSSQIRSLLTGRVSVEAAVTVLLAAQEYQGCIDTG